MSKPSEDATARRRASIDSIAGEEPAVPERRITRGSINPKPALAVKPQPRPLPEADRKHGGLRAGDVRKTPISETSRDASTSGSSSSSDNSGSDNVSEEIATEATGRMARMPVARRKPNMAKGKAKAHANTSCATLEAKGQLQSTGQASGHADSFLTNNSLPMPEVIPYYSVEVADEDNNIVMVPATAFADILGAYNILRGFSWQLRLSPFSLQSLIVGMGSRSANTLVDELFVNLLRALAASECSRDRKRRTLDLAMLDHVTWPEFVWEWLQLVNDRELLALRTRFTPPASLVPAPQTLSMVEPTTLILEHGARSRPTDKSVGQAAADTAAAQPNPQPSQAQPAAAVQGQATAMDIDEVHGATVPAAAARDIDEPLAGADETTTAVGDQLHGAVGSLGEGPQTAGTRPAPLGVALPGQTDDPALTHSQGGHVAHRHCAYDLATLRACWRGVRRSRPRRVMRDEYYTLGIEANARILARLADDLLEAPIIRAEIDRREAAGQMHAGRGGIGGSFAMRSAQERHKRQQELQEPSADGGDDGNTDRCVLCSLGGSLLCCDSCPAAYHIHCINESQRSIPAGEWLCPECRVGGRGEAAGLRVPPTGFHGPCGTEPVWVAYGCVFKQHTYAARASAAVRGSARLDPALVEAASFAANQGAGNRHAGAFSRYRLPEDARDAGITMCTGRDAAAAVGSLRLFRPRNKDEQPHPTSLSGVMPEEMDPSAGADGGPARPLPDGQKAPGLGAAEDGMGPAPATEAIGTAAGPHSGMVPLAEKVPKPDLYINRYRNGWVHAMTAYQTHLEGEQRRLRRVAGGAAQLALMALPLPLPRFQWPHSQVKGTSGRVRRCGRCATCVRPMVRQACLAPAQMDLTPAATTRHTLRMGRLAPIQDWMLRCERELWPLLDGPWAARGSKWRRTWQERVRTALDPLEHLTMSSTTDSAPTCPSADTGGTPGQGTKDSATAAVDPLGPGVTRVRTEGTGLAAAGMAQPSLPVAASSGTGSARTEAAGRESVQRLAACLLQLERGIRRQLHIMHSGWEPCSHPSRGIVDIWGLGGAGGHAACRDPGGAATDAPENQATARSGPEAMDGVDAVSHRGRRARVSSRAPRRIVMLDPDETHLGGKRGRVMGTVLTFQKKGSVDGATEDVGDMEATEGGDGAGGEDADGGEAGATPKPKSKKRRSKASSKPTGHRKGPKRPKLEDEDAGDEEGDASKEEGEQGGGGANGSSPSLRPSRATTPENATGPVPAASVAVAGEVGLNGRLEGGQSQATNVDGRAGCAAPSVTSGGRVPADSIALTSSAVASPAAQDHMNANAHAKQDGQGPQGAATPGAEEATGGDDDIDEATQALVQQVAKQGFELREKSSRAAAHAARTKTKGQLSGKLSASVWHANSTPPAGQQQSGRKDKSGAGRRSLGARGRLGGLDSLGPGGNSDEEEGGSSGSDAGDWWMEALEDMEDELYRHANRAPVVAGWRWLRAPVQRALGTGYLPAAMARRLARRGGDTLVPQVVRYRESAAPELLPRLQWIAATEAVTTGAALALQVRQLGRAIRWAAIKRPLANTEPVPGRGDSEAGQFGLAGLSLAAKRLMSVGPAGAHAPRNCYEYFVVPDGATTAEVLCAMTAVNSAAAATAKAQDAARDKAMATALAAAQAVGGRGGELSVEKVVASAVSAVAPVTAGPEAYVDRPGEDDPLLCYWAPEWKLPMWMVRLHEERVRTEDAAKARVARDSAQAGTDTLQGEAEDQGVGGSDAPTCAGCGCEDGDDEGKDALWLQCEGCLRWYHGACEGVSQQAVDAQAAKGTAWTCKSCVGGHRTRRNTEKRGRGRSRAHAPAAAVTRQFAANTAILRLGPDGQPDPSVEAEVREQQKAAEEAAAAEERARQQRRHKGGAAKGRGKRGREEVDDESDGNRDEEDDKIYCLCKRLYTDSQSAEMVACDGCDNWFHFSCVHTTKAEVDSLDKWFCPDCSDMEMAQKARKDLQRKRAMELAAAARAAAVAAGEQARNRAATDTQRIQDRGGSEDVEEGPGLGLEGSARRRPDTPQASQNVPITAAMAAAAVSAGFDWRRAARGVVSALMNQDCSAPFLEPVSEEDVPDYFETIRYPMDLGTIHAQLGDPRHYQTPNQVLEDVALVWANCHEYNRPKSVIAKQADQAAVRFKQLWTSADIEARIATYAGQQLSSARHNPALHVNETRVAEQQRKTPATGGGGGPVLQARTGTSVRAAPQPARWSDGNARDAGGVDRRGGEHSGGEDDSDVFFDGAAAENWAPRAKIVLKALMREECAVPFLHPVDQQEAQDYLEYVQEPMDLATVVERLSITSSSHTPAMAVSRGGYSPSAGGLRSFLQDVDLIWANCRAYNTLGSSIVAAAAEAKRAFVRIAKEHGLPSRVAQAAAGPAEAGGLPPHDQRQPPYLARSLADGGSGLCSEDGGGGSGARAKGSSRAAAAATAAIAAAASNPSEWMKHAQEVVRVVMSDPECGWPFAKAVKVADAPGYLDVITHPMDLGTINDKLRRRKYANEQEFLKDVALVWSNCFLYNEEGDDYYNMGRAAQALFARHYHSQQQHASDQRAQRAPTAVVTAGPSSSGLSQLQLLQAHQQRQQQQQHQHQQGSDSGALPSAAPRYPSSSGPVRLTTASTTAPTGGANQELRAPMSGASFFTQLSMGPRLMGGATELQQGGQGAGGDSSALAAQALLAKARQKGAIPADSGGMGSLSSLQVGGGTAQVQQRMGASDRPRASVQQQLQQRAMSAGLGQQQHQHQQQQHRSLASNPVVQPHHGPVANQSPGMADVQQQRPRGQGSDAGQVRQPADATMPSRKQHPAATHHSHGQQQQAGRNQVHRPESPAVQHPHASAVLAQPPGAHAQVRGYMPMMYQQQQGGGMPMYMSPPGMMMYGSVPMQFAAGLPTVQQSLQQRMGNGQQGRAKLQATGTRPGGQDPPPRT